MKTKHALENHWIKTLVLSRPPFVHLRMLHCILFRVDLYENSFRAHSNILIVFIVLQIKLCEHAKYLLSTCWSWLKWNTKGVSKRKFILPHFRFLWMKRSDKEYLIGYIFSIRDSCIVIPVLVEMPINQISCFQNFWDQCWFTLVTSSVELRKANWNSLSTRKPFLVIEK